MVNYDHLFAYNDAKTAYQMCAQKVREIKGSKKIFYIGATDNPEERFNNHQINLPNMYVLCSTSTKSKTEKLEEKLIRTFGKLKKNYHMKNNNTPQIGGGEGLVGNGPWFIYIMTN